jgi:hypothetical protein
MENIFVWTGMNSPTKRFLYALLMSGGIEYLLKPSYAFTSDGEMRPWVAINGATINSTYVPAFMIPAVIGLMFSIFV